MSKVYDVWVGGVLDAIAAAPLCIPVHIVDAQLVGTDRVRKDEVEQDEDDSAAISNVPDERVEGDADRGRHQVEAE